MTVTLQIVSDLHLETPKMRPSYATYEIEPRAPYLALLGDIGNANDDDLYAFLRQQLQQFDVVFFVIGNHEAHGSSYADATARLRAFEHNPTSGHHTQSRMNGRSPGRFVLLNRDRFDIPGTKLTILGCTLFSHIIGSQQAQVQSFVTDFTADVMADWSIQKHNDAHQGDVNWLNDEVRRIEGERSGRSILILTHFCPSRDGKTASSKHVKDLSNFRSAFSTDLSKQACWINPCVKVWAFGHTHHNCDVQMRVGRKTMRVVTNQKGYAKLEAHGFDPSKIISIDAPVASVPASIPAPPVSHSAHGRPTGAARADRRPKKPQKKKSKCTVQ